MKLPCEIVQDILPLYQDGVCSAESKNAVNEHLLDCPACTQVLKSIQTELKTPPTVSVDDVDAKLAMRALAKRWKRSKIRVATTCILAAMLLTIIGMYIHPFLFEDDAVSIPVSQVEVASLYDLPTGQRMLRLRVTDGKAPYGCGWSIQYDDPSNPYGGYDMYMSVKRPRIILGNDPNAMTGEMHFDSVESLDDKVRMYYGTPEESILIWEPGMEIPVMTREEAAEHFGIPADCP